MKFKMIVCNIGDKDNTWEEEYDKNVTDARKFCEETIAYYNRTLRDTETAREIIDVIVVDANSIKDHDWQKVNLVPIKSGGQYYDTYKCRKCNITGKRYSLGAVVFNDPKYRANVYLRCDTSLEHINKRNNK